MGEKKDSKQGPESEQTKPSAEQGGESGPDKQASSQPPVEAEGRKDTAPSENAARPNRNEHTAKQSRTAALHKYTLYTLVGGLVVSALISILAILIGEFSNTIQRAIGTTALMMVHALLALMFISVQPSKARIAAAVITNVTFVLIVASFFTSVLGTWQVLSGDLVANLYATYVLALLMTLIISLLLKASRDDAKTQALANAGIGSGVFLYILMQPWMFEDHFGDLPDFYFRLIAAVAVLFTTLAVLTTIFHRLHTAKQRAALAAERARLIAQGKTPPAEEKRKRLPVWAIVLIALGMVFFVAPTAIWLIGFLIFSLSA